MSTLLNPKVHYAYRRFLTEAQMNKLLKFFKSKKSGVKDFAFEVEEVFVGPGEVIDPTSELTGHTVCGEKRLLPMGNYFHVRVEYIV